MELDYDIHTDDEYKWFDDNEDENHQDFTDVALMKNFPRISKQIRERIDHFTFWRETNRSTHYFADW